LRESIQTTLPKAKELSSYTEKLITKAKKGDLHNRRQVISGLATKEAAHKLVDEIAPKLKNRNSGFLRIERQELRRGDGAQLARISFVDDLKQPKGERAAKNADEAKPKEVESKEPVKRRRSSVKKAQETK
jgi:large subunit ribosomal protein L17